jgi:hypothetical protein
MRAVNEFPACDFSQQRLTTVFHGNPFVRDGQPGVRAAKTPAIREAIHVFSANIVCVMVTYPKVNQ